MVTISQFYGIRIKVNVNDHNPPHCHIEGNGGRARYDIKNMNWMDSDGFTKRDLRIIEEMIKIDLDDIWNTWRLHHE